ncbi:thioester reductase domain-containing protein [Streptomyces sp. NPDC051546]|uniref:thioester reductase domain-containing protein n=1 Tax=Streptomyces sp. NPDC051546 TaxID=3365655 RepID=UPI00379E8DA2
MKHIHTSHALSVAAMVRLAALDESIRPCATERVLALPQACLLTGATGFVGAFLLAELLHRQSGDVYCLVRADDEQHALRRILASQTAYGLRTTPHQARIHAVPGDLGQPLLGLSRNAFDDLHHHIGSIYHCGAQVNWTASYADLAAPNVEGTQEILRLAVAGAPTRPVHHISTVGVFSSPHNNWIRVNEATNLHDSGPLTTGYAQTKWVAEQMVHTAHRRGTPVTIHRINTGGHSVTGQFNRLDHLPLLIRACTEAELAPDHLPLPVQPAPIDYVARAIVQLAARHENRGSTFHLVNDQVMTWPWLFACVRAYGYRLSTVPLDEWIRRMTTDGAASNRKGPGQLAPFLRAAASSSALPISDSTTTRNALRESGLHCPPLTPALIRTYMDQLTGSGYLAPP